MGFVCVEVAQDATVHSIEGFHVLLWGLSVIAVLSAPLYSSAIESHVLLCCATGNMSGVDKSI